MRDRGYRFFTVDELEKLFVEAGFVDVVVRKGAPACAVLTRAATGFEAKSAGSVDSRMAAGVSVDDTGCFVASCADEGSAARATCDSWWRSSMRICAPSEESSAGGGAPPFFAAISSPATRRRPRRQ